MSEDALNSQVAPEANEEADESPFVGELESPAPGNTSDESKAPASLAPTLPGEDGRNSPWYYLAAVCSLLASLLLQGFLAGRLALDEGEALRLIAAAGPAWLYETQAQGGAWLSALSAYVLGIDAFSIRAPALLAHALIALSLYFCTAVWFDSRRAGFYAVFVYLLTPMAFVAGIGSVNTMAPALLWLWGALCVFTAARDETAWMLLPAGLLAGAALFFSASALLFWPLALIYLALNRRDLLRSSWFPMAVIITLLAFLPTIIAGTDHSLAFLRGVFRPQSVPAEASARLREIAALLLITYSPGVLLGVVLAAVLALLRPLSAGRLVFWFSVPMLMLAAALGSARYILPLRMFFFAFLLLLPLFAAWLDQRSGAAAAWWQRWLLAGPFAIWGDFSLRRLLLLWVAVPALLLDGLFVLHSQSHWGYALFGFSDIARNNDPLYERMGLDELSVALRTDTADEHAATLIASRAGLCAQVAVTLLDDATWRPACDVDEGAVFGRAYYVADTERPPQTVCQGSWRQVRQLDIIRAEELRRRFYIWRCGN